MSLPELLLPCKYALLQVLDSLGFICCTTVQNVSLGLSCLVAQVALYQQTTPFIIPSFCSFVFWKYYHVECSFWITDCHINLGRFKASSRVTSTVPLWQQIFTSATGQPCYSFHLHWFLYSIDCIHDMYCWVTMVYFFVMHSSLYFSFPVDIPNIDLLSATAISTGWLESPMLPLINVFIQEVEYAILSTLQHPLHNNLPKKLSPKILC